MFAKHGLAPDDLAVRAPLAGAGVQGRRAGGPRHQSICGARRSRRWSASAPWTRASRSPGRGFRSSGASRASAARSARPSSPCRSWICRVSAPERRVSQELPPAPEPARVSATIRIVPPSGSQPMQPRPDAPVRGGSPLAVWALLIVATAAAAVCVPRQRHDGYRRGARAGRDRARPGARRREGPPRPRRPDEPSASAVPAAGSRRPRPGSRSAARRRPGAASARRDPTPGRPRQAWPQRPRRASTWSSSRARIHPGRSGDIQLLLAPFNSANYESESQSLRPRDPSTSHASVWMYLERVPLVVYAPGHRRARRLRRARLARRPRPDDGGSDRLRRVAERPRGTRAARASARPGTDPPKVVGHLRDRRRWLERAAGVARCLAQPQAADARGRQLTATRSRARSRR